MELVQGSLGIIAVVEFLKRIKGEDYKGAGIIVLAGVVGALAGFLGIANLDIMTGIVAGLDAVGIHTTAQAVKIE